MYLLYLDESGNETGAADRHFVLAGLAVHETGAADLAGAVDSLQDKLFPNHPPVHFHANEVRAGKNFWRRVRAETKGQVLEELGALIATAPRVALFGAVIEKTRELHHDHAVQRATVECCSRFDEFLRRQPAEHGPQHGLLDFAEGRFEQRARVWVQDWRRIEAAAGGARRLSDIPFFAPATESRLLQLADYVAHALWILYERRLPDLIRPLIGRFDSPDGRLPGLKHVARDPARCPCPACHARREPGAIGPWLDASIAATISSP